MAASIDVRIGLLTSLPPRLTLLEVRSGEVLIELDLRGAEFRLASPEAEPPPFEGMKPEDFVSFLFLKLKDERLFVLAERRLLV